MSGRRRPSGVGSNSQKFATIRMPDGREARVPAAKDACTLVCIEAPGGGWPSRAMSVLLYDATWMEEGKVFQIKEMRPGHGMGECRTVRVIDSHEELEVHEGTYGQIKRWVLVEELLDRNTRLSLSAEDLLQGGA